MLKSIFYILALLALAACSDNGDEREATTRMPFVLRVPAENVQGLRTPGDPGTPTEMPLPTQLYFFITDGTNVQSSGLPVSETDWQLTDDGSGRYVYTYQGAIEIAQWLKGNAGANVEAYVVAARNELVHAGGTPTSAYRVKNLQFDLADNPDLSLRDLYANHGTLDTQDPLFPRLTLTLYHVAAKVDVRWQISDANQAAGQRFTKIELTNLPKKGYYFSPNLNTDGSGRVTLVETNTGNDRIGRADAYVLQRKSNTVDGLVTLNDGTTKTFTAKGTTATEASPFTVYYRIDVKY